MNARKRKSTDLSKEFGGLHNLTLEQAAWQLAIRRLQRDNDTYRTVVASLLAEKDGKKRHRRALEARTEGNLCLQASQLHEFLDEDVEEKEFSSVSYEAESISEFKRKRFSKRYYFNEAVQLALKLVHLTRSEQCPCGFAWPGCMKCLEPIDGPTPGVLVSCGHILCAECLHQASTRSSKSEQALAKCPMCGALVISCSILDELLE